MFCQFMILKIFPYYTAMVWYIRVTARNGGTHLKKPKNGVFQYLDTPPTLRPKNSIKELTDLVNFFICTLKLIHICSNKIILRLKVMCFRIYKGLKIGNFKVIFCLIFLKNLWRPLPWQRTHNRRNQPSITCFYVTTHKLRKFEKNLRLRVPNPLCKM